MCLNHPTRLSLFDGYNDSVSEIWGTHKSENIENLHLDFCKQFFKCKDIHLQFSGFYISRGIHNQHKECMIFINARNKIKILITVL